MNNIVYYAFLAGRVIVGGYFLMAGLNHFMKLKMMAGYAKSKGTLSLIHIYRRKSKSRARRAAFVYCAPEFFHGAGALDERQNSGAKRPHSHRPRH